MINHTIANDYPDWRLDNAADMMRRNGYLIVDRNSHPITRNQREVIDLVVWRESDDHMVAVSVGGSTCLTHFAVKWANADWKRKARTQSRLMRAWCRLNKWHGKTELARCDIYGTPEAGRPVIDLITNIEVKKGIWK